MKYRRLTTEELIELEPDFVRYLASNTVTADDWERIKTDNPDKAEKLIDLFSDIVFDRTFEKSEYLEFKTPKDIESFHFQPDKVILNGLRVEGTTRLDVSKNISPEQMLGQIKLSGAQLQLYSAEKSYRKGRGREMFEMLERGIR